MTERYNITLDYHGGHVDEEEEGVWVEKSLIVQAVRVVNLQKGPSKEIYTMPVDQYSSPEKVASQLRQLAEFDREHGNLENAERWSGIADQIESGDLGQDLPGYEVGE